MSATAALTPQPPPPTQSHILSLASSNNNPLSKRSSESPRSGGSRTSAPAPSPVFQAPAQRRESPSERVGKSPALQTEPKVTEDRKPASPAPENLPESTLPAVPSPKEPLVSPPSSQQALIPGNPNTSPSNKNNDSSNDFASYSPAPDQAPSQLALLLSQAYGDTDALRRELALEKKRAARAERLLTALQAPPSPPNSATGGAEVRSADGRLSESAAKAILDAETRAEKAERVRDEVLHALASLSVSFAELERYEAACALRSSDARGAYSRLVASLTTAHPLPQSSPASTSSPRAELRLNLPRVPAPLPSLPPANYLSGPSINPAPPQGSSQSSRYPRPLQTQATYAPVRSPIDARHSNVFESLPLPPPPAATGLASINTNLPLKRHRSRAEDLEYEEQKRQRLTHEVDIDMIGPDTHSAYVPRTSSRHYQSGPPSAHPLSAHPTALPPFGAGPSPPSRIYDRPPSVQFGYSSAPGLSYQREGPAPYPPPPSSGSRYSVYEDREREYASRDREPGPGGMVRIDARELVREAKARERRGREREPYAHHPHSEALTQQQPQGGLHTGERVGRRSASRGSTRSKSSLSLDEMLLETATDGGAGRGRPSPGHPPAAVRQGQNYGAVQATNGITSPHSAAAAAPPPAPHPSLKGPTHSAPATNGIGRRTSIPASQLMTLHPSGTIVSGGGGNEAPAAASVDPAVQYPGLRTCRQCNKPGRYKDGKCVEKWGPGPQGPGTVCDRCRKKMKRVERRGTLDSSASLRGSHSQTQTQKASQPTTLSLAPTQSFSQSQSQSGRTRAPPARTDTLIVDTEKHPSDPNRGRSPGHDSRYHHSSVPPASAAARHPSLTGGTAHAHYVTTSHPQAGNQHQHQTQSRRAPTPPYITAISSREQHGAARHTNSNARRAESDEDILEDDRGGRQSTRSTRSTTANGSTGVTGARYAHSESYARQPLADERDELADDADGDAEVDDADADGSGVGSAEAEDAEIMDAVDATMKVED